jgi:hypothetical protein
MHNFGDPKLLSEWSKHAPYRCVAGGVGGVWVGVGGGGRLRRGAFADALTRAPAATTGPTLPHCRFADKLEPKKPEERDFPEARERLRKKGQL